MSKHHESLLDVLDAEAERAATHAAREAAVAARNTDRAEALATEAARRVEVGQDPAEFIRAARDYADAAAVSAALADYYAAAAHTAHKHANAVYGRDDARTGATWVRARDAANRAEGCALDAERAAERAEAVTA